MKSKILVFAFKAILFASASYGQTKYLTLTGHVWFYSHTAIEDIEAHNNQVTSYITKETGEVAFQMLIKSFKFKKALMEEHFNENYMESTKFPKAEFKGKITNLTDIKFDKDGVYKAKVEGDLTIHGVIKKVSTEGTIEMKGGKLLVKAKFNVSPTEYGITIPDMVKEKIAKALDVNVDMTYELMKK